MYMYVLCVVCAGYERVCSNLVDLVTTLKSNSAAKHKLTLYYKEYKWLDITEYPTEDELVTLALMRIKQDPSQYDRFVTTLCTIEGMDLIVNAITAGMFHYPFQFSDDKHNTIMKTLIPGSPLQHIIDL